ncbi:unnamed protein product [Prorocentrum cordatum]|uniref:Electron transfer flavoprotein-ubiquinone oxidoreductase n=1 Tax=Prorocentrum cordatum TaxID=2364126 RepID=A0ABN9QYJ0_9DINO|nr:unnamed protein product [Polarella glacialis]
MEFDIVVVGAGPAGLSAAIRAKQVATQRGEELSVCVIEKGAEVGAHILSGNVFEPRALNELIPDWKTVVHMAPPLRQSGNYVISLGMLCRWLAEQELGVDIFPGFAAAAPVICEDTGAVKGVQLQDVGIAKSGAAKDTFEPGMRLLGKQTILTEGARGSISEDVMARYGLRDGVSPQHYGLGVKEVWEIPEENHVAGTVVHTVGWPLDMSTYGGSFIYHMKPNLIHIGMVVGLGYSNPWMSPYQEFQRFKHHPRVKAILEGGKCISYGARVLNEGGVQAVPKLTFPGGMLAGCSAGFLNVPKIKGSHTAMKTGMLAGEAAAEALIDAPEVSKVWCAPGQPWRTADLVRAGETRHLPGLALHGCLLLQVSPVPDVPSAAGTGDQRQGALDLQVDGARQRVHQAGGGVQEDRDPKPDGVYSFELLENLIRSGVNHEHDQPAHLKVKPEKADVPLKVSLEKYAGPEGRFCPAKVYEYVPDESGDGMKLQINAQNCVHCKCCSIKTPQEFIKWTVPEGSGGPQYAAM